MSFWTYVKSEFIFDSFYLHDNKIKINEKFLDEVFGKTVRYTDWNDELIKDVEENPDNYLPCGSEETLEKEVWTERCLNAESESIDHGRYKLNRERVKVTGSLRDFWATEPIIKWFKRVCNHPSIGYAWVIIDRGAGPDMEMVIYENLVGNDSDFHEYTLKEKKD